MMITDEDIKNFEKGPEVKLTIKGKTESYPSYRVPLDYLFFNNLNGRIATYIEENSNSIHPLKGPLSLTGTEREEYNDTIARFIKASADDNGKSFEKTKSDIKEKGQQRPGVILRDGRVIDGNRRFTCLRELKEETGDRRYGYFECVILDIPKTKDEWQTIKVLELNLQFNVDEKKDYNPIDFLASFYKDTRDETNPNRLDRQTYCHAYGRKGSTYNEKEQIVNIRLDYLEWRNSPKAFYLLKKEKLDGPIEEVAKKVRKWSEDEWNDKKDTIYKYRTFSDSGDRTRNIRELLKSASEGGILYQRVDDAVVNSPMDKAMDCVDSKPATVDESTIKENNLSEVRQILNDATVKGVREEKAKKFDDAPKEALSKLRMDLDRIEPFQINRLEDGRKKEVLDLIKQLKEKLDKLEKDCLDDEDVA